jgi:hypothetical protein
MKTDKPKLRYGDHARVQHGLLSDEEAQLARVEKGVAKERAKNMRTVRVALFLGGNCYQRYRCRGTHR